MSFRWRIKAKNKTRSIYTIEDFFRMSFESIQQRHKEDKNMNSNEDRERLTDALHFLMLHIIQQV